MRAMVTPGRAVTIAVTRSPTSATAKPRTSKPQATFETVAGANAVATRACARCSSRAAGDANIDGSRLARGGLASARGIRACAARSARAATAADRRRRRPRSPPAPRPAAHHQRSFAVALGGEREQVLGADRGRRRMIERHPLDADGRARVRRRRTKRGTRARGSRARTRRPARRKSSRARAGGATPRRASPRRSRDLREEATSRGCRRGRAARRRGAPG